MLVAGLHLNILRNASSFNHKESTINEAQNTG